MAEWWRCRASAGSIMNTCDGRRDPIGRISRRHSPLQAQRAMSADEVDHFWDKLSARGQGIQCGSLKDRVRGTMTMDLFEALYTTRAMRRMQARDVSDELIPRLLDAAVRAQSGGGFQHWCFIVTATAR